MRASVRQLSTRSGRRFNSSAAFSKFLAEHNHDTRDKLRELFSTDDVFRPRYNLSLPEERELAYQRLKRVCDVKTVSVRDFRTNPRNIFTVHEMCGQCDGSLATKFTVQFNLFGGTVLKLGTDRHMKICDEIDTMQSVGCFGLTELGYGNNAVEMETTATYDPKTDEFVINTPTAVAQKYWITNGAVHAHYCVVFARIILPCGTDEGLHGFVVPIRNQDLSVKPDVKVWDMGYKIGLNGIDNAALWFNHVRVPRDALLDQTSQVAKGGEFTSAVADESKRKRKRFIVLADQLLSGRVCIAFMVLGSTQMVLTSTVRYSTTRLGVGPKGLSDTAIMDYQLQRNTIMPLVANTYALKIALNHVAKRYSEITTKEDATAKEKEELIRICCIVKPLITWHAEHTATTCRERCGGQGFLAANRFGEAIVGAHAGITAEGDNRVMQLKVATELLKTSIDKSAVQRHVMRKKFLPASWAFGVSGSAADWEWHLKVFRQRYDFALNELAYKMHSAKQAGTPLFDSVMQQQSDLIQALGNAYGEKMVAEACDAALKSCDLAGPDKATVQKLVLMWALDRVRVDAAFLSQEGIVSGAQLKEAGEELGKLSWEMGGRALELVEGFGIPNAMVHEPIANDWRTYNANENPFGELDDQRYRTAASA